LFICFSRFQYKSPILGKDLKSFIFNKTKV
jgi:hypothetical protein